MTHIQRHRALKIYLRFFEKFEQESKTETPDQKDTQQPARGQGGLVIPPDQEQQDKQHHTRHRLIQLRRVPYNSIGGDPGSVVSLRFFGHFKFRGRFIEGEMLPDRAIQNIRCSELCEAAGLLLFNTWSEK